MRIDSEQRVLYYQILIFLVLVAGIILAGYLYYHSYEQEFRAGVENQLTSVGDLKVDELVRWRNERLGDAGIFVQNNFFSSQVSELQHNPANTRVRQDLLNWLSHVQSQYHYNRVYLLSPEGKIAISVPNSSDSVSSTVLLEIPSVFEKRDITVIDFYRDEYDQKIYLTMLVPIFDPEIRTRQLGVLALQIDPEEYLYPFLSKWPTPSSSAETLLLRRDGDTVLYLNELRFRTDVPLSIRLALNQTDRPAVKAALGQEGIVEGVDYRGVPVITNIRKVPESPWFMVARIDTSEVLKPLQTQARDLTLIVLFLLFVTGAGLFLFRKRESERFYLEQLKIKEALRESDVLLRGLFDTMPSGAGIYSVQNDGSRGSDYIIADFNRASLVIEGKRKEEVVGRSLADLRPNIDEFGLIPIFQKVWKTGETVFYPAKIYVDDAYTNWYENYVFRLPTGQIVAIYNDVTESKRAEEALQQSEERLQLTLDAANDGIWDWNVPTGSAIFSPRWYSMLGYEPGEMPPTYATWISLIHPDDLQLTEQRIADHIQKKEEGYTVEFRMKTKKGNWTWILARGKVIEWDVAGDPVRMVGTHTDISDRKQAEIERERLISELARSNEQLGAAYEELSGSEEELRYQFTTLAATEEHLREKSEYLENLITYANVPIIVWDPAYIITRINHAFENLIGRSANEVIGSPFEILFPQEQKEHSMRLLETTQAGVRWDTIEMAIQHLDGSIKTVLWNSSTVYSTDGSKPVATIAQGQDITLRKMLERENEISIMQIQKNLAQLSILNDEIRNPLMVILMSAEMIEDQKVTNTIAEQTRHIDEMVIQLDKRWVESEKVLTMIRKNYQIDASSSTDLIIRSLKEGGPGTLDSQVSDSPSSPLHHLLAEEIQAELFTILDSIDGFIFVADLETYEILYLNRLGRNLFGDIAGKKCYQVIQKDQSGPCPFCTNHLLTDEFGPTGIHQKETQNTRNGRWYDCRDRTIRWSDGRLVHLQVATDITERKFYEDTLKENEYTFRKLYEESSDPILIEKEDRFVECNQAAITLLGMSAKEQLIGSTPLDISPEYQPDGRLSAEAAPEYINRAYTEGLFRFEWMVKQVNGTPILLEVSFLPIIFKGEEMLHITWRDITEKKQIEKAIRESEEHLRAILDATPFPVALVDIQDNHINYWSRSALTLFGHVAPTTPEWYQIAYPDPDYRQEVIDRWKPFLETAKMSSQPVNAGEYRVTCREGSVRICELYATFLPDKLIVTFNDVTERKQGEELLKKTNDELQSLTKELEEREEELAKQIQEIIQAKHEWEGIFQAIGNPAIILDAHHRIRDANNAILALSGKSLDQLRTMHCWELFHGPSETQPHEGCPFEKMKFSGKLETAEIEVEALGEVFLVSCTPLFNAEGALDRVIHIATNITEITRIKKDLRQSEANYLQVINTMQETLSVIDFEGNFLFTNDAAAYNVSGGTPGDIIGRNIRSFIPLPQAEVLIEKYQTVITSGHPLIQDVKVTLHNRDYWFHNHLKPIQYGDTPVQAVLSLSLDITERKQIEESLVQAREWLGITFRAAKAGAWDWDFPTGTLTWSPEFFELFDLPPDTPASFDSWISMLHPDDRAPALATINQSVKDHRYLWNEYRILLPDGNIRWIAAGGTTAYNELGEPLRMSGVCIDITDKKLSEESLHEAIQKLHLLTGLTRHDIFNQLSAIHILQERALQMSDLTEVRKNIAQAQEVSDHIEATIRFTREYENFGIASSGWQRIHLIIESAKGDVSPGCVMVENLIPKDLEVYADPIIRKVFSTLIDNAVRHGGEITHIRFSSHMGENTQIITCEDDGVGIPSGEKGSIFDHGFGKNTGIGLFLASEILSITGLSIREVGIPGEGARFEILVPSGKFRMNPDIPDKIGEKPCY